MIALIDNLMYALEIVGHTMCWGTLLFVLPTLVCYPLRGTEEQKEEDGNKK